MPADLTVGQFVYVIRKRIKVSPEKAIFMFVKNTLPPTGAHSYRHCCYLKLGLLWPCRMQLRLITPNQSQQALRMSAVPSCGETTLMHDNRWVQLR